MTAPIGRRGMIAKIHIAKKDLALTDESYRDLIERLTSHRSAGDCTDVQLHAVLAEFQRLGWKGPAGKGAGAGHKVSRKPHVRKVWAIWGDLRPLLDNAGDDTLRGFVKRQTGIADPEWLNPAQATAVIHGLNGWLARVRGKQEKPNV